MSVYKLAKLNSQIIVTIILAAYSNLGQAVTKNAPLLAKQKVESFTIVVNDSPRIIANGATVEVAEGDKFKITHAELAGRHEREYRPVVNIIGFRGGQNDLGRLVSSSHDLIRKWSVDAKGEKYKVRAEHGNHQIGAFYIQIIKPQLRYVVVEINGRERLLHPNGKVVLNKTDKIKVKRIATNISEHDETAMFKMKPLMGPHNVKGIDFFNLAVSRGDKYLAGITLVINK